jgi:hypothetical protein
VAVLVRRRQRRQYGSLRQGRKAVVFFPLDDDALAPTYLPEIPQDLFSGRPLIYRPADQGYLLYSVGVNGRDEQGRSFDDDPRGDDLAIRMPLGKQLKRK